MGTTVTYSLVEKTDGQLIAEIREILNQGEVCTDGLAEIYRIVTGKKTTCIDECQEIFAVEEPVDVIYQMKGQLAAGSKE